VPIGIGGYLVWDHRRKVAAREAASAERLNILLGATTHVPPPAATPQAAEASRRIEPVSVPAAAPATPVYVARERVLSPAETLVFYLLKTGLPEYHVFAHVALRALLDANAGSGGYALSEQSRRLAWHAVDFLVCDRNMRPCAVVELERADTPHDSAGARRSWIDSAGLRYIALDAKSLPRKDALRALVLGETASTS